MIISKDIKQTKVIYLWDLVENYVGEEPFDLDIIRVLDTEGNVIPKADELEVVYEVTYTELIDSTEMTPEQENEWLRSGGF